MPVLEHFLTHKTHESHHQITQFKQVTPFNASNDLTLSEYFNFFISHATKDIKIKPNDEYHSTNLFIIAKSS